MQVVVQLYNEQVRAKLAARSERISDGILSAHPSKDAIKFVQKLEEAARPPLTPEEQARRDQERIRKVLMGRRD